MNEKQNEERPSLSDIIFSDPRCLAYLEVARPYGQIPKKAYHQFTYKLRLMRQSQIREFASHPQVQKKPDDGSSSESSEQSGNMD